MLVELTAKGRRLVEKAWREDMDVENAIVANLSSRNVRNSLASWRGSRKSWSKEARLEPFGRTLALKT
jgi:DNA-binding MarR family transcriptional regulator